MSGKVSAEQIAAFQDDGFLIVPGLFDPEEAKILHAAAKADKAFDEHAHDLED
ncbi:MAG: phytanoyl-CoA dioxygenase family protein, partial [Verrucomicrobiales bacterium]|nr:phytanoyl-CoA dioxygenase family protein [Verrucomicrobiales bacterium]